MKVFVTRNIPGPGLRMLQDKFEVEVYDQDQIIPHEVLLDKVQGANALLSLLTDKIGTDVFESAGPDLRIVANYAVGFDNIDIVEAKKRGIAVTFTPYADKIIEPVAEHAMSLLLATAKKILAADKFIRDGKYNGWDPNLFLDQGIGGKTIGIIGAGRIGSHMAKIAKGFDLKVVYNDVKPNERFEKEFEARFLSLEELLGVSDFVSLHCNLTNENKHLIDGDKLALMKENAILVNTARGALIHEESLVKALQDGVVAGAGLDVYDLEPQLAEGLVDLPNVVLTPHIASATVEARYEMSRMAAGNIIAALDEKNPPNLVS